jgi:hypothetical protein
MFGYSRACSEKGKGFTQGVELCPCCACGGVYLDHHLTIIDYSQLLLLQIQGPKPRMTSLGLFHQACLQPGPYLDALNSLAVRRPFLSNPAAFGVVVTVLKNVKSEGNSFAHAVCPNDLSAAQDGLKSILEELSEEERALVDEDLVSAFFLE